MENKRIAKTFVALLASAVMMTSGISAVSASAAVSTTTQAVASASVSSGVKASVGVLSPYKINLTQCFTVAVSVSEGKAPYSYKFGYSKGGKTTYVKTIKTSSPYVTYNYKFTSAGSYVPVVVVSDASGSKVTRKLSTVTVKNFKADFSAVSPYTISTEQAFQTAVSLTGGKGSYTYKFGYTTGNKTVYTKTATTGAEYMSYTYKFTKPGSYVPVVQVTDGDKVIASSKLSAVTVKDFKVDFGALSPYIIDKTQGFQVTASVAEGTGSYTYKFGYIKDGKKTYVKTQKTASPYMTFVYKFTSEGEYTPFIEVMDGQNLYASNKLGAVTVKDLKVAFGKVSSSTISTEQAFQATASVGGGKADYTYRFGYIKDGVTTYVKTAKTASPYMVYAYKFKEAGTYIPVLELTDADGARRVTKMSAVTVKDFKVEFGAVSSYKIKKTQCFQSTASVSSGTGSYTYKFGYIKDGKKTYLSTEKTGSPYMTYVYKFPAAGSYVPFIEVMDGENLYASAKLSAVTVTD